MTSREDSFEARTPMFCFTLDSMRVCHLGDLGHTLSRPQVKAIGPVDLLFLPMDGRYIFDAVGA